MIETKQNVLIDLEKLTDGERIEMAKMGILSDTNQITDFLMIHNVTKLAIKQSHCDFENIFCSQK